MKPYGSDGFHMVFAAQDYAAGENGKYLDGAVVCLVDVLLPDNKNRTIRYLYHRNHGNADAKTKSKLN
jgi:hypothetical protein